MLSVLKVTASFGKKLKPPLLALGESDERILGQEGHRKTGSCSQGSSDTGGHFQVCHCNSRADVGGWNPELHLEEKGVCIWEMETKIAYVFALCL